MKRTIKDLQKKTKREGKFIRVDSLLWEKANTERKRYKPKITWSDLMEFFLENFINEAKDKRQK